MQFSGYGTFKVNEKVYFAHDAKAVLPASHCLHLQLSPKQEEVTKADCQHILLNSIQKIDESEYILLEKMNKLPLLALLFSEFL